MSESKLTRNPASIAGAVVTTVSAVAFVVYALLEAWGFFGPYAGLLGFLLVPAAFLLGLVLIPFGMWREGRRRQRGAAPWSWPVVDVGRKRTRVVLALVGILTIVNLGIVALAGAGAARYMESNEFCGQVCHTPMTPQFTAHAVSPHAKVDCVGCHVGPGASGLVRAKLNGTRQLYLLAINRFARPIPEPIGRIPQAAGTCAGCHDPGRPRGDLPRTIVSYADDEKSTQSVVTLIMRMSANHWHARADVRVEYVAADDTRESIPYIRATVGSGAVTEYFAEGVTARPAGTLVRMDCLDCHNRPAHTFSASADRAVDAAIASGGVSRDLPFVRREMVASLKAEHSSQDAAEAGISKHFGEFYRTADSGLAPQIQRAVAATAQLYRHNVFPDMKVTWGTYLSKLGHVDAPGCFRCHDDGHKARDGRAVRQDCDLCHKMQ